MPVKRPVTTSQTHIIYERMRADVISGRLRSGERLKIGDLGETFSGSLGAIRESLSRLTAEGLVVAEPQRGFRVAPTSLAELRDLTMVRVEIEGICLRRSIAIGDLNWEARVVAAYHSLSRTPLMTAAHRPAFNQAWVSAHTDFHHALASASDSPWLMKLREMLFVQSERYREICLSIDANTRDVNREHGQIMDAMLARDETAAVDLMKTHLEKTAAIVEARMASETEQADPRALS